MSDQSMGVKPLLIKPLLSYERKDPDVGRYEVIQKIVTPSPKSDAGEAEIETSLETYIGPNGVKLWRRVVVRSGPTCPNPVVHVSYMLQGEGSPAFSRSLVCWASFPERPNHKLLCVLSSPTLLCIWDVYTEGEDTDLSGEGHSISLPFEASSIYAIAPNNGLMIQRVESYEDKISFDALNKPWGSNGLHGEDDDDGFVLKAPPRPVRIRESTGTSIASLNISTTSNAIPSLFSLSHPLDDVLPISHLTEGDFHPGPVSDVFEKVIFMGVLRWVDASDKVFERKEYNRPICVTYHTQKRRHAVWEIKCAPPPLPQAPLWQVSSQWRSDNGWNSHIGVLQQDLEDMELLGTSDLDSSHFDAASRHDALADALGVRRTPRKAVEEVAPRGRSSTVRANRNRAKASTSISLLSPLSRPPNETQLMDVDISVESAAKAPLLTVGPFTSLHPKLAMTCLYEEKNLSSEAERVFLASNQTGSGILTLCLLCPNEEVTNPKQLRFVHFDPVGDRESKIQFTGLSNSANGKQLSVSLGPAISCIAAQPVDSSEVPLCYHPQIRHRKQGWKASATDILVLRSTDQDRNKLSLFRSGLYIVDCDVPQESFIEANFDIRDMNIFDIRNGVKDRVDMVCCDANNELVYVRGSLSLKLLSNPIGEKMLQAIESALSASDVTGACPTATELAINLRADSLRLEQLRLQQSIQEGKDKKNNHVETKSWDPVQTLLLAVFYSLLFGGNFDDLKSFVASDSIKDEDDDDKTAWDCLLESNYHQLHQDDSFGFLFSEEQSKTKTKDDVAQADRSKMFNDLFTIHSLSFATLKNINIDLSATIFDAIHLYYEELKLQGGTNDGGQQSIASILAWVCNQIILLGKDPQNSSRSYLEYYKRDLGEKWLETVIQKEIHEPGFWKGTRDMLKFSHNTSPPSILSWVDDLLAGRGSTSIYNSLDPSKVNASCRKTISILRVFPLLCSAVGSGSSMNEIQKMQRERDYKIVCILLEEGYSSKVEVRDNFPAGLALPLLEVLHRCRKDKDVIDLSTVDAKMWSLIGRDDLCENAQTIKKEQESSANSKSQRQHSSYLRLSNDDASYAEDKDLDGICPTEKTSSMLFPDDNRMREVGRLLRSSRPVYLNVPRAIEVSDHDFERMKQDKLLLLSRRILSLPLGRGMLTIGNMKPVPAEPLPLPELCLVGRVPPTNARLALDTTECPTDMKVWPDFHNGVAAGLRLPLERDANEMISKITRTWIVYNRPPKNSQAQSQGNNTNDEPKDLGHAHGGLLMALGLRGHLTTLEMTDIFDYLTQGTVTTTVGVLLGMAANMRGTCDVAVSKMLCLHIPSLIPQHFSAIDVASTVQAAAVAGAGLLYQGSSHRMMTEFLLNEIGKRPTSDMNVLDREAYTLSCGIALGMVNLCAGDGLKEGIGGTSNTGLADLRIEDRLYRYIVGGIDDTELRRRRDETDRLNLPSSSTTSNSEKCSCIYEGDLINTDVTAPGATLALGLIYMKSGNKTIASAIALPDTHFLLEYVRPDFLMLRVISRALILWEDVMPSSKWIDSQLPDAVRSAYQQMRELAENLNQPKSHTSSSRRDKDFDRQAVRLIYTHVIAGACFAMGLRYAGTGNKDAASAIFERVMELRDLRDGNDPVSCALRPTSPVLEMCLCCATLSLSMVLAGTGDLEVLRLLKVLRWRCDEEVNYGSHMTYGAAIGLLFLGGGSCTLGREAEDVAALIMAFFPRYPSTTSDNQYHLQALRNLYALAVKNRELCAVDVDTGEQVFVPIEVHFEEEVAAPLSLTAPCLLINTDLKPRELRVVSERYYPVRLTVASPPDQMTFFVKRKSAHLSYRQDPDSQRSLLVQAGTFEGEGSLDVIESFTGDREVLAFAKYLCDVGSPSSGPKSREPFSIAGFCCKVLHECLFLDTQEALPLYLSLRSSIELVHSGSVAPAKFVWDYRLIRSYYQRRRSLENPEIPSLLNSELVAYLNELFEEAIVVQQNRSNNCGEEINGALSIYYGAPADSTAMAIS